MQTLFITGTLWYSTSKQKRSKRKKNTHKGKLKTNYRWGVRCISNTLATQKRNKNKETKKEVNKEVHADLTAAQQSRTNKTETKRKQECSYH
jgi:hypothetical protein